jgi:hypothetical protein
MLQEAKRLRVLLALTSFVVLIPKPALAWGAEGHHITALIAADELTPAARAQVQTLLGSPDVRSAMEAPQESSD